MSTHGRPRRARSAPLKMREAVSAGDVDAFLGPDDDNGSDSSDGAAAPPAISERLRFEPPGFEGMSDQDLRDELVNKWGYAEILLKGPGGEGWTPRESLVGWLRKVRQKPLQQLKELTSAEPDEGILVESPAAAEARALAAADPAAIRKAYARERAPSQKRKKSEQKGCGGTRPEALNKLLEPLGDGTGRFGLACCVARGVIKYGSLRCMTEERLGDYVSRGKAVYEHLGPKSKPHVDFVQRLEAELKFKNQTRYFYGSMCRCHLDNVTSLLQRVEKKLRTADPKSGNDSTPRSESKMADPPDDVSKHNHAVYQLDRDVYSPMMGLLHDALDIVDCIKKIYKELKLVSHILSFLKKTKQGQAVKARYQNQINEHQEELDGIREAYCKYKCKEPKLLSQCRCKDTKDKDYITPDGFKYMRLPTLESASPISPYGTRYKMTVDPFYTSWRVLWAAFDAYYFDNIHKHKYWRRGIGLIRR